MIETFGEPAGELSLERQVDYFSYGPARVLRFCPAVRQLAVSRPLCSSAYLTLASSSEASGLLTRPPLASRIAAVRLLRRLVVDEAMVTIQ
jgi:hypothetical protein